MRKASRKLFRDLTRTWLFVGTLLLGVTWWAGQHQWPMDNVVYDQLLSSWQFPTDDRLLIAAIDERSLEALGRWPWPRATHARFVDQARESGVSALLIDIVFAEPGDQTEDQQLASALKDYGHAFLPIIHVDSPGRVETSRYLYPIDPLRNAAQGMGHINIRSSADGVVRKMELYQQGIPQLTLSVVEHLVEQRVATPPPGAQQIVQDNAAQDVLIPYRANARHYPRVSYVDILEGRVPPSLLEGRIILLGATASGLGDRHPTPFGGAQGGMPGIEIQANLLDGLIHGDVISQTPSWVSSSISTLFLLLFMGLIWLCRFRHMAKLTLLMIVLILTTSWGLISQHWWWPPFTALIAIIAACILISWRCQATALQWFQLEIERLEREPSLIPRADHDRRVEWGLLLHQRLYALEQAITRMHDTRQFISDSIDSMPIATLVVDVQGNILLPSDQGRQLLTRHQVTHGGNINDLLERLKQQDSGLTLSHPDGRPTDSRHLDKLDGALYKSLDNKYYHLKVSTLVTAVNAFEVGWLVGFVDVTSEQEAEEQRANLLRFLSHDLKAPQSSILSLIQLQRHQASRVSENELLNRVEKQARNALTLTDSFMQLTKIEFGALEHQFVILSDVILEAIDQAWPSAKASRVRIESNIEAECPMDGDKNYLLRAIYNLLDNAIKYSSADSVVMVSAKEENGNNVIDIQDQGVGIPEQDLPTIFDSYQRSTGANLSAGYGLGLSLVKSVVERHGGEIQCHSHENAGTRFRLIFTAHPDLLEEPELEPF